VIYGIVQMLFNLSHVSSVMSFVTDSQIFPVRRSRDCASCSGGVGVVLGTQAALWRPVKLPNQNYWGCHFFFSWVAYKPVKRHVLLSVKFSEDNCLLARDIMWSCRCVPKLRKNLLPLPSIYGSISYTFVRNVRIYSPRYTPYCRRQHS